MNLFPFPCPAPPSWRVEWEELTRRFEWFEAMKGCPQDVRYHAEGDVWTHARMVCEAMAAMPEWRDLPESQRELLFAAAVLHDSAKPVCTRVEEGRITSRGHSRRGALLARRLLWDHATPFALREQVCALVRRHQTPYHLLNRTDCERMAFLMSQTVRCDWLAILARADLLGRHCNDQAELLDQIGLFEEFCREAGCWNGPRAFPSDLSRFEYFRAGNRDPLYHAHEQSQVEVILMSGLPGSGKDTWIQTNMPGTPQISLDAIREQLDDAPGREQGAVVQAARELAREHLRAGRPFIWNATNLSRERRAPLVDLFTAYRARVRIVYVEAAAADLFQRNRTRSAPVPMTAIERMMQRWEVPEPDEAPHVEWWIDGMPQSLKL